MIALKYPPLAELAATAEGLAWSVQVVRGQVELRIRGGRTPRYYGVTEVYGEPTRQELQASVKELCAVLGLAKKQPVARVNGRQNGHEIAHRSPKKKAAKRQVHGTRNVLRLLCAHHPKALSAADIARHLGVTNDIVRVRLSGLSKRGKVAMGENGTYMITEGPS